MTQKIDFGIFLPQSGMSFKILLERTTLAEQLGYHSMWFVDHMWSLRKPEQEQLECLTLMAALGTRTEKIRLGTLVICNSFRNPAMLAKSLSSIDNVIGGRLEIALGAGWMRDEFLAYGFEFPPIATRLRQLDEGVRILKLMLTEERATFKGEYYSVSGAVCNPKPVQKPHPPLTIGGSGEKVMLGIVAKYADRWNCPAGYLSPEHDMDVLRSFQHKFDVLKHHCQSVGRDIATINVSEQLLVCLGRTAAEVEEKWKLAGRMRPFSTTGIKGTPAEIVEQLRARAALGIQHFTILFGDGAPPATLELFAREVMPALS